MPPQKSTSILSQGPLANRVRESVKKHAADPIDWGAGGLEFPPGIVGGVLEVEECRIEPTPATAKRYAGEPRLRISFAALSPDYHTDPRSGLKVKVRGRHHYEFVYICDTSTADGSKATSFDENISKAMNTLKKLAGQECFETFPPEQMGEAIEEVAKGVEEAKPTIRVRYDTNEGREQLDANGNPKVDPRTGQPYKRGVFVNWGEVISAESADYAVDADVASGVRDDSANQAAASAATQRAVAPKANGSPAKQTQPAAAEPAADEIAADSTDDELGQLAELAQQEQDGNIEGEENQKALLQKGVEAGLDLDALKLLNTWQDVLMAIRQGLTGAGSTPEPEVAAPAAEPEPPKQGSTMTWVPPGQLHPKTKKQVRMPVIISGVNTTLKTCILKDSASSRIIMSNSKPPKPLSVPWSELEA